MTPAARSPACPSQPSTRIGRCSSSARPDVGDRRGVLSEQRVGALGDRDRTLRVGAQGEARHAEGGRLLLHPAGVGDDCARADLQAEEVEIADRLHGADAGTLEAEQQPFGPQPFRGARVDREEDGSVGGESGERCHDASQLVALVDVGWAMQGHEHVLAAADRKRLPRPAVLGARLEAAQGVDHGVADEVDPAFIDALGDEVRRGFGAVGEEEVGEPIGEDAVDLLGHRPVPGAQAGLDVRNRDPELGCRQRHGERRVDVAADAHQFRWILEQDALERPRERAPSARRGIRIPRRGRRRARGTRGPPATRPTSGRRNAVRCERRAGPCPPASRSAEMTGAILTKFGRAPTTWTTVGAIYGVTKHFKQRSCRSGCENA